MEKLQNKDPIKEIHEVEKIICHCDFHNFFYSFLPFSNKRTLISTRVRLFHKFYSYPSLPLGRKEQSHSGGVDPRARGHEDVLHRSEREPRRRDGLREEAATSDKLQTPC